LAKLRKIEAFSLVLHRALEEFKKRDFSEVATKDLLSIRYLAFILQKNNVLENEKTGQKLFPEAFVR